MPKSGHGEEPGYEAICDSNVQVSRLSLALLNVLRSSTKQDVSMVSVGLTLLLR